MPHHEHAPLTRHEETELARISQRLKRDGVRLDRPMRHTEWPFQLAAVLLAAIGGMMAAGAVLAADGAVVALEGAAGAVAIAAAVLLGVTPVRRAVVRFATGVHWSIRRRGTGEPGRVRRTVVTVGQRLPGRRRRP